MADMKNLKEHLIEVTIMLIEESEGDPEKITARLIAEKSGVGLGLINYHFGSKENLITACVQRIIGGVISEFNKSEKYATDKQRLIAWATYVFNFLYEHAAISRISILGDLRTYTIDCNSVRSQRGFILALTKDVAKQDKPMISFMLTAAIQVAFLGSDAIKELLGYDFTKLDDRAAYIEKLVDIIFGGKNKEVNE